MNAQGTTGMQVNIGDYIEAKAAGVTKIVKLNGVPHYTRRGYDPVKGTPVPILAPLDRDQIVATIGQMESDLENMQAVLADLDAAKEAL